LKIAESPVSFSLKSQ